MESKEMELGESPREGKFGQFGGRFVPEILLPALKDLEEAYEKIKRDVSFQRELRQYREDYCGRPSPLYWAKNLTEQAGGVKIYLKREDLCPGADFNSILGQTLLAKKAGKKQVIAIGVRLGIATAAAGAILGLEALVYLGAKELEKHKADFFKIESAGAKVYEVTSGDSMLKEAINIAFRHWAADFQNTYLVGSSLCPHPYPTIVRDFQRIIGDEIKGQLLRKEHRLPNLLVAYVGSEDAAIGAFSAFVEDEGVALLGVQAADAASLVKGSIGVLYGTKTYLLQDETKFFGAGPEHAFYKDTGRAKYIPVTAEEAQEGLRILAKKEGIMAASGTAHAVYAALQRAKELGKDAIVVIVLSGRYEKELEMDYEQDEGHIY